MAQLLLSSNIYLKNEVFKLQVKAKLNMYHAYEYMNSSRN